MRYAQVGDMVVDPGAPRAPLLAHAAQTFHVAVVVVRPDDRDVVGQFQPVGIDLQHLLVGCERLRDGLDRAVDVLGEDLPLVEQRLLEHPHLFVHGQRGRHGAVVQAAQRQRIDVLIGAVLAHALREHAVDTLLVLVVVPGPHRLGIPFAGGVQQWVDPITMANVSATSLFSGIWLNEVETGCMAGAR